jgi:hypothetical protein
MFVLVTLGCSFLGWEARIVQRRKESRQRLERLGVIFCELYRERPTYVPSPSVVRRWMGDPEIRDIYFQFRSEAMYAGWRECISRFPEANKGFYPEQQKQQLLRQIGLIPDMAFESKTP